MTPAMRQVAKFIRQAEAGVVYNDGIGALCPSCGRRARTYKTARLEGGLKIRYHHCANNDCILGHLQKSIKSVQTIGGDK